jgi:DNA-binding NarL/FixJ family response regulator
VLSTKAENLLSSIRILVADDYEAWRRQACLLLQARPELQVICEASDGSEAVQKAEELKPDLILLDIGLPKVNGIEAARRIRQLSPSSKIIFLSLCNSLDVVQEALSTGALAYVQKARAGSELLPVVEAVLRGGRFVGSSLTGYKFTDTPGEKAPRRHEVLFYSDETVLLDSFTCFIAAALKASNAAIVVATKSHRDSLFQKLQAECVDADGAIEQGAYISLDAIDALSTIMVNGWPDPVRLFAGIGGLIETAAKAAKAKQCQVAMCGEAGALLQAKGQANAAIRLEQLCDEMTKTHEVDFLCAYPLSLFHGEEGQHVFQSICAEHSAVIG